MILGVGLDLCPIERMQRALERSGSRFSQKVFTEAERAYCSARGQPAQHFAARFAAKEAVLKALGVPSGLSWHELEVVSTAGGAPELRLSGVAATLAAERGIRRLHLSLTHSGNMAAAVVIIEGGPLVASL
ncbi:MAG TPA: holo-ACP synthase [Pseudomonadota bacterium]|jgi:holo-[acyl-carrier protein] synthase|nr:holo-ACP synthase [Pseudomonadota bacterium]